LARHAHEDSVRRRELEDGSFVACGALCEDGHGVGELALVKQRDAYVDDLVAQLGLEVLQGGMACFLNWGVGAVEP
jgi:hypothetical protein